MRILIILFAIILLCGIGAPVLAQTAPASTSATNAAPITPDGKLMESHEYDEKNQPITGDSKGQPAPKPPNLFMNVLNTILRIALALIVIFFGAPYLVKYLARFTGGASGLPTSGSRQMSVVETLSFGPARSITLVAVGKRYYLVAWNGPQVSMLAEVPASELTEKPTETPPAAPTAALPVENAAFASILARYLPSGNSQEKR